MASFTGCCGLLRIVRSIVCLHKVSMSQQLKHQLATRVRSSILRSSYCELTANETSALVRTCMPTQILVVQLNTIHGRSSFEIRPQNHTHLQSMPTATTSMTTVLQTTAHIVGFAPLFMIYLPSTVTMIIVNFISYIFIMQISLFCRHGQLARTCSPRPSCPAVNTSSCQERTISHCTGTRSNSPSLSSLQSKAGGRNLNCLLRTNVVYCCVPGDLVT